MNQKTYQAQETIFYEGDVAETMFEVTNGTVGIYAGWGTPTQRELATLGAGEVFGEMGLVECYPRSATAVALAPDTTVNEILPSELAFCFQDQPDKVLDIMCQLSARLRATNERYEEAQRAVYEAVEAERAGKRRSGSLRARLSRMLRSLRDASVSV